MITGTKSHKLIMDIVYGGGKIAVLFVWKKGCKRVVHIYTLNRT